MFAAPSGEAAAESAAALVRVLSSDDDYLVRQWVAIALHNFAEIPSVVATLLEAVSSTNEDVDVRHNALASLWHIQLQPGDRARLEAALGDPDLGSAIRTFLDEATFAPGEASRRTNG